MSLLPRVRLVLARRPWLYWLLVGLCAAGVWAGVAGAQAQVERARARWGATTPVWVADASVAAGEALRATARDYPVAMVPPSALASVPPDSLAAHAVAEGEVLVAGDVRDDATVPAGWPMFAVPAEGAPALLAGDRVAVFGSGQEWCAGIVVATRDTAVEVAVPADCAAAMSAQLALGAVLLARTG